MSILVSFLTTRYYTHSTALVTRASSRHATTLTLPSWVSSWRASSRHATVDHRHRRHLRGSSLSLSLSLSLPLSYLYPYLSQYLSRIRRPAAARWSGCQGLRSESFSRAFHPSFQFGSSSESPSESPSESLSVRSRDDEKRAALRGYVIRVAKKYLSESPYIRVICLSVSHLEMSYAQSKSSLYIRVITLSESSEYSTNHSSFVG